MHASSWQENMTFPVRDPTTWRWYAHCTRNAFTHEHIHPGVDTSLHQSSPSQATGRPTRSTRTNVATSCTAHGTAFFALHSTLSPGPPGPMETAARATPQSTLRAAPPSGTACLSSPSSGMHTGVVRCLSIICCSRTTCLPQGLGSAAAAGFCEKSLDFGTVAVAQPHCPPALPQSRPGPQTGCRRPAVQWMQPLWTKHAPSDWRQPNHWCAPIRHLFKYPYYLHSLLTVCSAPTWRHHHPMAPPFAHLHVS